MKESSPHGIDWICRGGICQILMRLALTLSTYQELLPIDFIEQKKMKQNKKELCEILQTLTPNQNLGLKFKTCPNKDWLVNVIYTLKKTHEIFSKPSEIQQNIQMTENDYMLLQQLDTSIGRPKQLRFFRRTEQQNIELKINKKDD